MTRLLALLVLAGAVLAFARPAAAGPPVVQQFRDVFVDVDPCTGLDQTVAIDVTRYEVAPGVGHATHVVTTSAGYVGRGEEVGLFHDNTFLAEDILVNAATKQRIHAQLVIVLNPATGDSQVLRQTLTCIPGR